MRDREKIIKDFIDLGVVSSLMPRDKKGILVNPKLHLEVLLDIRDILLEISKKS